MNQQYDPASTYNTFYHLVRDLEGFIDTSQLELAFDRDKQAFLQGPGFKEQLTANPSLHREMRQQMREILLKHFGQQISISEPISE